MTLSYRKQTTYSLSLLVSILAVLLCSSAHGASRFCAALLTESEAIEISARVEKAIAEKGMSNAEVLEGMDRELADKIFAQQKRALIGRVDELSKQWTQAVREGILKRYDDVRKENARISNFLKEKRARGEVVQPDDPKPVIVSLDQDGLPIVPIVQKYRDLSLNILKNSDGKLGPSDFEQLVVQAVVEGLKIGKDKVEISKGLVRQRFLAELKTVADAAAKESDKILADSLGRVNPDWDHVITATDPVFRMMAKELNELFPLEPKVIEKLLSVKVKTAGTRSSINKNGLAEFMIPDFGLRAYYEPSLGSIAIEPHKGLGVNTPGILNVCVHGDGTWKSKVASFSSLIPLFSTMGYNSGALGQPNFVSIGMKFSNYRDATFYANREYQFWKTKAQELAEKAGYVSPVQVLGRSMGSARAFAHSYLFEGAENPVDAYVLMSFSNPLTMAEQVFNVHKQVSDGTISGVHDESLDQAKAFNDGFLKDLDADLQKDPAAFELTGDKSLALQGDGDEDGGDNVIEKLREFFGKYAPLAHLYTFENKMLKYTFKEFAKINPEFFEGTHFIITNKSNMTPEETESLLNSFPAEIRATIKQEDLPKLKDQRIEALAVMYGFYDYLADSKVSLPELQKSAKVFAEFRKKMCGELSFTEWYRRKLGLNGEPSSLEDRMKRAAEFWRLERVRTDAIYRAKGLLP